MALIVDEKNFVSEVLNASTPVLVNFWAPWCGLCRFVSPVLNRLHAESDDVVKLVSINADDNLRLATTYRLTSLPTIMVFRHGQVVYRVDEFKTHDELRTALDDLKGQLLSQYSLTYDRV
jgi:thioredoxin 1